MTPTTEPQPRLLVPAATAGIIPETPVRIDLSAFPQGEPLTLRTPRRHVVTAVVPCYNRPADLAKLLEDLAAIDLDAAGGLDLHVIIVDNASEPPLAPPPADPVSPLSIEFLRLPENTGGSGGFNAGLRHALAGTPGGSGEGPDVAPRNPDFLWLVDSDARVRADTLAELVATLDARPDLCAVGSAIADPATGRVFEIGGRVNRRNGILEPVARSRAGLRGPVICDYVAACSALVRADALRRAGPLPDVFLNADDVEWCLRLARVTGRSVAAVPTSVVVHPTFDRFQTWARYYIARNCLGPLTALDLPFGVRFRRAAREAARAVGQSMMGRRDLAELHLLGLRHAGDPALGVAPKSTLTAEPFRPLAELPQALQDAGLAQVRPDVCARAQAVARGEPGDLGGPLGLVRRLVWPLTKRPVSVVPARGRPGAWLAGRWTLSVTPQGFALRRTPHWRTLADGLSVGLRGLRLAARAARHPAPFPAPAPLPPSTHAAETPAPALALRIVILSYNRWDSLRQTIEHLTRKLAIDPRHITVVDNASSDGTPDRLAHHFAGVPLVRLEKNLGVAAFNRGVETAYTGDLSLVPDASAVLILDDDARPDPEALAGAVRLLAERPDLGAVTLHPRHPETGVSEWPFAGAALVGEDRWPVMGCGNLVRLSAWRAAGGYEGAYFLYRNDADLALTLLGMGLGVAFNPEWVVWHDSPAARRKSPRWHRLATRNWVWMTRRHARGTPKIWGVLLGWLWAHKLAGLSVGRHLRTVQGVAEGILGKPPELPLTAQAVDERGGAFRRLLRLRLRRGR